jgi:hypothetical protein
VKQEPEYDKGGRLQDLIAAADDSVKAALSSGQGLQQFLASIDKLTEKEMNDIAEQAIVLLESFYVHLPLKRAMHAVDPLQRLRLFQRRIPQIKSEIAFHHEITDIFTSLRDLHTNYILPSHFARMISFLPFRVEACLENGTRKYIVSKVAGGFNHPTFVPGVEIRYWNGIPIERAVEIAASYHAGSNPDARHARGVAGLTKRAMSISPPPDEEWVTINYFDLNQQLGEIRIDWTVSELPSEAQAGMPEFSLEVASALGLDLEGETFQQINKMLFAQEVIAAKRNIEQIKTAAVASSAAATLESAIEVGTAAAEQAVVGTDSTMPDKLAARVVEVNGKKYAYIRIFSFNVPSDVAFVNESIRLLELSEMPRDGLILDVRGNGGGLIPAGERLLQLFTPRSIEPTRFQFINTPANLRLCQAVSNFRNWEPSIERALQTGATFSAAFPITPPEKCNDIGQRYYGPVVLLTDARCYSTTDIFAAGFRDHAIGDILGVDGNTGAGGANVWTLGLINQFFTGAGVTAPLRSLAKNADLRVAIRRTIRVGPEAGTELEDLGVTPDERHDVSRDDLMKDNVDLIKHAAALLSQKPVFDFQAKPTRTGENVRIDLVTQGVGYVDAFSDGRPRQSRDTENNTVQLNFAAAVGAKIELRGYAAGQLVCSRRIQG